MAIRVSLLLSFALITGLCIGTVAQASSNPASRHLDNLVGTWRCSYRMGGSTRSTTSVGTRLNDNWIELKGATGDTLVTYDATRKQWVQFSTNAQGYYNFSTANEAPTAKTLTWHTHYPADMNTSVATISWVGTAKRVINAGREDRGKIIRTSGVCTKT